MADRQPAASEAQAYYYRRAEAELELAQAAVLPSVVKAHYELANLYLDRVAQCGPDADALIN